MQHGHSNEADWEAHIAAVGADYLDSAKTAPETITPSSGATAETSALVQKSKAHKKRIYPVSDSSSYISPYVQRNHSWNDWQFDQSDEVTWSAHTNATAGDHIDHVTNEMSLDSRLNYGDPDA